MRNPAPIISVEIRKYSLKPNRRMTLDRNRVKLTKENKRKSRSIIQAVKALTRKMRRENYESEN